MKTQIAAIEFGTSKIVTMIAQSGGMDRLDIIGSGTVPYDGYSDGDWNTPGQMIQRVGDSIAAAELEANAKIKEIYVGVPGEYIHVRSCETEVELPEGVVDEAAINACQDAAADMLKIGESGGLVMHRTPSWFIVDDGKKTMSPGGRGTRLRAMTTFVIADPQFIEDVSEMLGQHDITILGFLSPSLGESLLVLSLEERDRGALLIDVGYLNTEISVVEGDAIVYHAILPRGGGHITADLAMGLRIPMRAAEQIKRNYVFNPDEFDMDSFSEVYDESGRRKTFPRKAVGEHRGGQLQGADGHDRHDHLQRRRAVPGQALPGVPHRRRHRADARRAGGAGGGHRPAGEDLRGEVLQAQQPGLRLGAGAGRPDLRFHRGPGRGRGEPGQQDPEHVQPQLTSSRKRGL